MQTNHCYLTSFIVAQALGNVTLFAIDPTDNLSTYNYQKDVDARFYYFRDAPGINRTGPDRAKLNNGRDNVNHNSPSPANINNGP
jgi:hypothetical protein